LLAISGMFGHVAERLAAAAQHPTAEAAQAALTAAGANHAAILWGALASGLALAATAAAALALARGRLTTRLFALALTLIVGTDLWLNARHFWSYTEPYRRDPIIDRVGATLPPYRVIDLGPVYPGSALMAFDVPQVLGYHGNELRYYDELLGGKNEWRNLAVLQLWDLLAVRYAIVPLGAPGAAIIPGFRQVLDSVTTSGGGLARLFERVAPAPYARVVPGAVKTDSAAVVPTLVDPRMDYSRIVLFTNDQPVTPEPLTQMPAPSPSRAAVTSWEPGRMTVALDPAPARTSYLLIAENWYPDWEASVDGRSAQVLRGDYSLITVVLPAGAQAVELRFRSESYDRGKAITLGSLALLLIAALAAVVPRRARHG
jgi:hypothetical protein